MIPDYHTSRGRFAIFIEDQPTDSSLSFLERDDILLSTDRSETRGN